MEDKIEVREYVRTKDGIIAQIKNIDYEAEIYRFDRTIYINDFGMKNDVLYNNEMFKKVVVKHSKQLKDLIESGDFVNGYQVYLEEGELAYELSEHMPPYEFIKNIKIETVLTHQQFEANCYKVATSRRRR